MAKAVTAAKKEKEPVEAPDPTTETPDVPEAEPPIAEEPTDDLPVPDNEEPVEIPPGVDPEDLADLPGCPLVGDVVNYLAKVTGERRAAIVTKVNEPGNPKSPVSLRVLAPERDYSKHDVPYSTKPEGWQWKRVKAGEITFNKESLATL